MNIEKEFKLILLQYKLGDIILKEALEQVMDIYEASKKIQCNYCEELKLGGDFMCEDCVENFRTHEI